MKKKAITTILLALAVVGSLTACGQIEAVAPPDSTSSPELVETVRQEQAATAEATRAPIVEPSAESDSTMGRSLLTHLRQLPNPPRPLSPASSRWPRTAPFCPACPSTWAEPAPPGTPATLPTPRWESYPTRSGTLWRLSCWLCWTGIGTSWSSLMSGNLRMRPITVGNMSSLYRKQPRRRVVPEGRDGVFLPREARIFLLPESRRVQCGALLHGRLHPGRPGCLSQRGYPRRIQRLFRQLFRREQCGGICKEGLLYLPRQRRLPRLQRLRLLQERRDQARLHTLLLRQVPHL